MDASKKPRSSGRRITGIILILFAVAAILFLRMRRTAPGEEPLTAKADVISADLIAPTPEQLKQLRIDPVRQEIVDVNFEATGRVGFNEDHVTPVLAAYPGRVLEVLANTGDLVQTGQPLFLIESPDVIDAVNDLVEAHTNVRKAQTALDIAQKSAERARRLYAQEALSAKDMQAAESEFNRTQEDSRRAEAAVSVVRKRLALLGKSPEEIEKLESLPSDQTDRRLTIRAPIGGTIVDRKLGVGQYIKPDNQDPLYLISDLSTVWVTADIYEPDLPSVRVGTRVDIKLAAYPDRSFSATVSAINPTVDPATRSVKVRCVVSNAGGLLKPEMFARIRVLDAVKQQVVTVPATAVLTEGERSYVLVEESSGLFRRRQVKTGREIDGNTIVEEGLRPNDHVVTTGVLLLSNSGSNRP